MKGRIGGGFDVIRVPPARAHSGGLDHGRLALIRLHNSIRGIPAGDGQETQGEPAKLRKPRNQVSLSISTNDHSNVIVHPQLKQLRLRAGNRKEVDS